MSNQEAARELAELRRVREGAWRLQGATLSRGAPVGRRLCKFAFVVEPQPRLMELAPQLGYATGRERVPPGDRGRGVAAGERLSDRAIPPGQRFQPLWKIDAEPHLIQHRSPVVPHDGCQPLVLLNLQLIEAANDEMPLALGGGRQHVAAVERCPDSSAGADLSNGEAGEHRRESPLRTTLGRQPRVGDAGIGQALLDKLFSLLLGHVTKREQHALLDGRKKSHKQRLPRAVDRTWQL